MKNKHFSKILLYSILVFIFSLVFILLFNFVNLASLDVPYKFYIVQSGSMEPSIMVGDLIVSKAYSQYIERDVITFYDSRGGVITHRIVKDEGKELTTQGDANRTFDTNKVEKEKIIGKVVLIFPKIGYFITFLMSKTGFTIFIIVPLVLIVLLDLIKHD